MGPSTIRDVCKRCNNERLSALDSYGRGFCVANVRRFVKPGERGSLLYDYHKLARWLWKVHYNTARADKGHPSLFHSLIPYIIGDERDPAQPQSLLAGVLKAYKTTPEERAKYRWSIILPRAVRAADATLGPFQPLAAVCRLLSLNSYFFWSILWKKGVSRPQRRDAVTTLARAMDIRALVPPGERVLLRECAHPGFEVRAFLSRGRALLSVLEHFRR